MSLNLKGTSFVCLLAAATVFSADVAQAAKTGYNTGSEREWSKTYTKPLGEPGTTESKSGERSKSRSANLDLSTSTETRDGNKTTTRNRGFGGGTTTTTDSTGKESKGHEVQYGRSTEHKVESEANWGKHAKGTANASVDYGIKGSLSKGENGYEFNGDAGAGGKANARIEYGGKSDKWGGENANVQIGGKVYAEAEAAAELRAAVKANSEEISAKIKAEVGVSVGVGVEVPVNIEVLGVPVDITFTGKASYGAKAKAEAGFGFNRKTGKFYVTCEAGAVLGGGLEGSVTIEVGAKQLFDLITRKGLDVFFRRKYGKDPFPSDITPFDGMPESEPNSNSSRGHYQGLKPIRLK